MNEGGGVIWVDYLLLAVLVLSGVVGVFRGLVREALALLAWVLAIWGAWSFAPLIAPRLSGWIGDPVLQVWAARVVLLVGILIVAGLLTWLISYLLDRSGLTGTDRLLGGLFGVARGAVLAALLVILLQFAGFERSPWWQESKLIPYAAPLADKLKVVAAESVERLGSDASTE
ncbi:MAG: CvpA family protein [Gammaproteobacteria bacterium]|nr:MAG: CvpA family protein [Gammaproteobacteria bacterium]